MKIPQKLLNLQDVRKSDALIRSPIRSLTPRVQLCPQPATDMQQFIIMNALNCVGLSYQIRVIQHED